MCLLEEVWWIPVPEKDQIRNLVVHNLELQKQCEAMKAEQDKAVAKLEE